MTKLTAERLREVLQYDVETGVFTWAIHRKTGGQFGTVAGTKSKGYLSIVIDGVLYSAHRLAWLYVFGEWPREQIDHINEIKTDNRIANLRDVSSRRNSENRAGPNRNNKSGYRGVAPHQGKWRASIKAGDKRIRLWPFDSPEEAHAAYMEAKRTLHTGFTR